MKKTTTNYTEKNQKVRDFIMGFILNIGITMVIFSINFSTVFLWFDTSPHLLLVLIGIIVPLVFLLTEILLLRKFFKTKRYIAIGMLSSLLLPFLLTGFCSTIFLSVN